jgi:hypothetical protein
MARDGARAEMQARSALRRTGSAKCDTRAMASAGGAGSFAVSDLPRDALWQDRPEHRAAQRTVAPRTGWELKEAWFRRIAAHARPAPMLIVEAVAAPDAASRGFDGARMRALRHRCFGEC